MLRRSKWGGGANFEVDVRNLNGSLFGYYNEATTIVENKIKSKQFLRF